MSLVWQFTIYPTRGSFGDSSVVGSEAGRGREASVPICVSPSGAQPTLSRTFPKPGPITAIFFDTEHGSMWGGASDFGEDYGIAW